MAGIYIHVPFCDCKCPYCDFYSVCIDSALMDAYTNRLCEDILGYKDKKISAETVYFGGGTPNLLGEKRLKIILNCIGKVFSVSRDAEITIEINPTHVNQSFFKEIKAAGFNRLSIGLQSANEDELRILGRTHTPDDVIKAVNFARKSGLENISLDLMLALPESIKGKGHFNLEMSKARLLNSINFIDSLEVSHVSSYMLKIEEGTRFFDIKDSLNLPNDDQTADLYFYAVDILAEKGYVQYEISNFAKPGFESKHNLTYWHCEEYIGFGPSAHSFYGGKRFYQSGDISEYLAGEGFIHDGDGGSIEEYVMLNLRLREGVSKESLLGRFANGELYFDTLLKNSEKVPPNLIRTDSQSIYLTKEGFAVSNAVILTLLG